MPIFNRKNPLQLKAVSRPAPSAGSGTAASDFSASVSLHIQPFFSSVFCSIIFRQKPRLLHPKMAAEFISEIKPASQFQPCCSSAHPLRA